MSDYQVAMMEVFETQQAKIEALTAENERLREALIDVTTFGDRNAVDIARQALAGKDEQ